MFDVNNPVIKNGKLQKSPVASETHLSLISNFQDYKVENVDIKGTNFLKVKGAVMECDIILNELFYPLPVILKSADSWSSYVPITNGHPPNYLMTVEETSNYKIGFTTNPRINNNKKLILELYFQEDILKNKHTEIYNKIQNREIIDCSTGFVASVSYVKGIHKGNSYMGIVNELAPNHLAVLPNGEGAYSIKSGGGVGVTNANKDKNSKTKIMDNNFTNWLINNSQMKEMVENTMKTFDKKMEVNNSKLKEDITNSFKKMLETELPEIVKNQIKLVSDASIKVEKDALVEQIKNNSTINLKDETLQNLSIGELKHLAGLQVDNKKLPSSQSKGLPVKNENNESSFQEALGARLANKLNTKGTNGS